MEMKRFFEVNFYNNKDEYYSFKYNDLKEAYEKYKSITDDLYIKELRDITIVVQNRS